MAGFLRRLDPDKAYLAVPTRPMAVAELQPPSESALNRAFQLLSDGFPKVEYLIGYEGDAFASSGDIREDLLSISAVHPLREEAVRALLQRTGSGWEVVRELLEAGELKETEFADRRFYLRALSRLQDDQEKA